MRSVAHTLVVIICAVLIVGCGGAQSRFASHMQRGQDYFSQGNFAKAGIEFRNALLISPKNPQALVMAGRSAEGLGRVRDALGLYQAAIDASPDNTDARARMGRVMVFGGAPERALTIIEPGLVKHPEDAELLTYRGAARLQLKKPEEALADVEHALRLAPGNPDAVALRASMYRNAGELDKAIALVSAAVHRPSGSGEAASASIDLREVLVSLYVAANDPTKAEQELRELVSLKPEDSRYRSQLAHFYARAGRLDDAQHVLEEAVKVLPHSDEAKLTLVDFMAERRSLPDAERVLQGFITSNPDDYDLRLGLGTLLQRAGSPKEAVDVYREVIRRDETGPKGLIARDRIASIDVAQGRVDDARQLIDQVLQKNSRDNEALGLRAEIAMQRADPAAAIADLRAVLRDQPEATGIRSLLARAYLANGEPALAEEALHAALDLAPADTSLRMQLAQLLLNTQRPEQAITLLEQAASHDSGNAPVRELLARAYLAKGDFAAVHASAEELKSLRPKSAAGYYLAGLAAEGQKQLDEARKEFQQALALEPRAADALTALVQLELSAGRSDDAVALVKKVADQDPSNAFPLNLLGELYTEQKQVPLGIATFNRATQVDPKWWVPYRNLGMVKFVSGDTAGAIAAYQAGIKVAPSEPKLVTDLAALYEKQGRIDDSIACYEAAYRLNSHVPVIANNLAMLLVTYKRDRASLDRARDLTASFASSNDGSLLDTDGWVHFKRGEYSQALPELERAVASAPNSKEIHYHLAMVELHSGQTDRARAELETALAGAAHFSGSDEARTTLASLKQNAG